MKTLEEIKDQLMVVRKNVADIKDFEAKHCRIGEWKRSALISELKEMTKELKREWEEIFAQIEEEISQFAETKPPTEVIQS